MFKSAYCSNHLCLHLDAPWTHNIVKIVDAVSEKFAFVQIKRNVWVLQVVSELVEHVRSVRLAFSKLL